MGRRKRNEGTVFDIIYGSGYLGSWKTETWIRPKGLPFRNGSSGAVLLVRGKMKNVIAVAGKIFKSLWFKIAVTAGIITWLVLKLDFGSFLSSFSTIRLGWMPLILVSWLVFWVVNVFSFYVLLMPYGKLPPMEFFKYQVGSLVLGVVTPSQIGEAAILVYLKKNGIGIQRSLPVFIFQKVINLVLVFVSGLYFFRYLHLSPALYLGVIGGVAGFVLLLVFTPLRIIIRDAIIKKVFPRWYDLFKTASDLFRIHYRYLLANVFLGVVKVFLMFLIVWAVFQAFGIPCGYFYIGSIYNLNKIAAVLPITLNGFGLIEGGVSLMLSKQGFDYNLVLAALLFHRLCDVVVMIVFSLVFVWMGGKYGQLAGTKNSRKSR
jgi:uncharacterized membrane protein YbhN (UPF0104 family)